MPELSSHPIGHTAWYRVPLAEVWVRLNATPDGLTTAEAEARRKTYGANALLERKRKSPVWMFLGQFRDFMILVLAAAAVLSGIVGDMTDMVIILVIIVLNAVVGF